MAALPPPPLTTPIVSAKEGTVTGSWGRWLSQLQAILRGASTPNDWVAASLPAGVTNFAGHTASYRKDALGVVWVRGLVVKAAVGTVFTLPAGFRPVEPVNKDTPVSTGGVEGSGRLTINTDGTVSIQRTAPSTWGATDCSFTAGG